MGKNGSSVVEEKRVSAVEITLSNGDVVKMRRPKVRDMMATNDIKDPMENELALIGNLTEMTREEILELDIDDYQAVQEVFKGFRHTQPKK